MTPSQTKRIVLTVCGAAVALVLIAAVVTLLQGPSLRRTTSSGSAASPLMMRAKQGLIAPGAPSYAASAGVAVDEAYAQPSPMVPQPYPTGGQTAAEVDQKIIKNGSLRLTVDHVADALGRITTIATSHGGFVQNSSSSERGDGTHEGEISIRVPASAFEAAMADAKALAKVVNYENATGQDVTEQYTDLQAQLRNAQAQEEEYLRIMKKADTVEDILKVQERLGQVRGLIESLQGRTKYLENVTALSTVTVSLAEEPTVQVPTKEFRPGTIVKEAVKSLVEIGQQTAAAAIWIAIVGGGVALPIALLALIVWLLVRRRKPPLKP